MTKYAVIGAGPMGLACAYELSRRGHRVDIYEADDRLGGMSAHFDFNGLSIERYYHFICKHDEPMFELLEELGIDDKLHWKDTSMGYFYAGRHYAWGNPFALLRFSPLPLLSRLRYGLHMFYCTKLKDWKKIDGLEASQWIKGWIGETAYKILWERLFALKFHKYVGNLSASWIWARIRRVGQSRKSLFQETMGYLQGGSQTLLDRLEQAITEQGGNIYLSTPVGEVLSDGDAIKGLQLGDGRVVEYEQVISTVPLPFVPKLLKTLPEQYKQAYEAIKNIGVVCLLFKLKRPITPHFWLNISDARIEIPGLIEMSNLQPFNEHIVYVPFYLPQDHPKFGQSDERFVQETMGYFSLLCPEFSASDVIDVNEHIVYVPFYLPQDHPKFAQSDEAFVQETIGYFKLLSPEFSKSDVIDVNVSRYGFAQPICPPAFLEGLPPIRSEISGLYIMDTSYYYPEDRSISESVQLGRQLIKSILS